MSPDLLPAAIGIVGHGAMGRALAGVFHGCLADRGVVTTVYTSKDPDALETPYRVKHGLPGDPGAGPTPEWVFLAVPDDALGPAARALSDRLGDAIAGIAFIHTSGALPASVLDVLAAGGASTASMHPLQSFPSEPLADLLPAERLRGVPISLQGDPDVCDRLERMLSEPIGAEPFRVSETQKEALHIAAVLASNAVVPLLAAAGDVLRMAGLQDGLRPLFPLLEQTARNVDALGAGALTGPVKRGDVETIQRHLERLRPHPDLQDSYAAATRTLLALLRKEEGEGAAEPASSRIEALLDDPAHAFTRPRNEASRKGGSQTSDPRSEDRPDDIYARIYQVVNRIPAGCVTTYGAVARAVGVASGARMVGYALNNLLKSQANGEWIGVPAHRVVNRLGQLTGRGYFYGDSMRERLAQEGVRFTEEYTIDLERHFWDPQDRPPPPHTPETS